MSCLNPDRLSAAARCCTAILLGLVTTVGAMALPEDRDEPIHITADQALRDEKQGKTVYSGNVHMNQGTLRIDADSITIFHSDEELQRVIAEGAPAKLQQQPEPDKGLVKARARTITYYRTEDRVHLQGDAHIEQDGSTVTGDSIEYMIDEQLVRADSDQAREGRRVQVVIPPQAIQDNENERGATDSE